jgi:hypothetical protein
VAVAMAGLGLITDSGAGFTLTVCERQKFQRPC